jgi:hypothetical protein
MAELGIRNFSGDASVIPYELSHLVIAVSAYRLQNSDFVEDRREKVVAWTP